MKVYDGTAMIADKSDAWIIPVRIDGLERSPWSYMRKSQTKKVWFPKVTVTILPRRKLEVNPELRGKARRQTAGLALQDIMVNTAVETAEHRQDAVPGAARCEGHARQRQDHPGRPATNEAHLFAADHGGPGARRASSKSRSRARPTSA